MMKLFGRAEAVVALLRPRARNLSGGSGGLIWKKAQVVQDAAVVGDLQRTPQSRPDSLPSRCSSRPSDLRIAQNPA